MKILRLILNLALTLAIIYVGYQLYKSIEEPILFEQEQTLRNDATISKLKKIRSAQLVYKAKNDVYASDFDTLIQFIKNEDIDVVKIIGDPNDSTVVVRRETVKIPVIDSLFSGNVTKADSLPYIPYNNSGAKFKLRAKMITKNEVELPAFRASVPYNVLYEGMKKKYYSELDGLTMRVGSLKDGTTTGNWEK